MTTSPVGDPDPVRWSVSCGCGRHGDHLACDATCRALLSYACVHPVGVEITSPDEQEADRLHGVPVIECGHANPDYPRLRCAYPRGHDRIEAYDPREDDPERGAWADHGSPEQGAWWSQGPAPSTPGASAADLAAALRAALPLIDGTVPADAPGRDALAAAVTAHALAVLDAR